MTLTDGQAVTLARALLVARHEVLNAEQPVALGGWNPVENMTYALRERRAVAQAKFETICATAAVFNVGEDWVDISVMTADTCDELPVPEAYMFAPSGSLAHSAYLRYLVQQVDLLAKKLQATTR